MLDADGWFHTGDIGQIEDSGALRIIDRKKQVSAPAFILLCPPMSVLFGLCSQVWKPHPIKAEAQQAAHPEDFGSRPGRNKS